MNTSDYLLKKYGATMTMDQLAEVLHLESAKIVVNAVSAERFPIPTFRVGRRRYARTETVAKFLEEQEAAA